ncbi:hypothetical protein BC940DRAFT_291836 [Gongronella butleri]|nr:hypothetical protein BC940DRAFT_291836 [Gongronella butleri]
MLSWLFHIHQPLMDGLMALCIVTAVILAVPRPPPPIKHVVRQFGPFYAWLRQTALRTATVVVAMGTHALFVLKVHASSAMPESEETSFEEQFKYIIVTSSALKPSASQQSIPNAIQHPTRPAGRALWASTLALCGAISVAHLVWVSSLFVLFWVHCLLGLGIWMVHKHTRRCKIREVYAHLLHHLQSIVVNTQQSDAMLDQLTSHMRYVDMMAQGYSLFPGKTSLQAPPRHQSRLVDEWLAELHALLHPYAAFVAALLQQSKPLTHPTNLASLQDMYSQTISSDLASIDSDDMENTVQSQPLQLDHLELLIHAIHTRRRQWFMHLLALEIMTRGHDSARSDYDAKLAAVEHMMLDMRDKTAQLVFEIKTFLASDRLQDYLAEAQHQDELAPRQAHRSRMINSKLDNLEKQIWQLRTKLILCRHEAKRPGVLSLERLNDRYTTMDSDLSQLRMLWDDNKATLQEILRTERNEATLPSPPYSPATASTLHAAVPMSTSLLPELPSSNAANSRHSWMTMAATASFNESRRMYRLHQRRQDNASQESLGPTTKK